MKRYEVRTILKMLSDDGWVLKNERGSHRQYVHPQRSGKVTVNGKPEDTSDQDIFNRIFKHAAWR